MIRILLFAIFLLFSVIPATAETTDVFDEAGKLQSEWDTQKAIPDSLFEETIDKFYKSKTPKKKSKHKELMPLNADENAIEIPTIFDEVYTATLLVPLTLVTVEKKIDIGYYKITTKKESEKSYFLNLYQGNSKIASVPAKPTNNDYNEENINYVRILPVNDDFVKIIYGSLDYNLEALVQIYNPN